MRNEMRNVSDPFGYYRLTVRDWFAADSHFTGVTLGDGTTAVQSLDVGQSLTEQRMESRRWRDGDVACANGGWRVAA